MLLKYSSASSLSVPPVLPHLVPHSEVQQSRSRVQVKSALVFFLNYQMEPLSYFFSEKASPHYVITPLQSLWHTINTLTNLNCVHILPHHQPHDNPHFENIEQHLKRADVLISKIQTIKQLLEAFGKEERSGYKIYKELVKEIDQLAVTRKVDGQILLSEVEGEVNEAWSFLVQHSKDFEILGGERRRIVNEVALMTSVSWLQRSGLFGQNDEAKQLEQQQIPDTFRRYSTINFTYFCGLINSQQQHQLTRLVFRISKGNAFLQVFPLDAESIQKTLCNEDLDQLKQLSVFLIIHEGGENNIVMQKLNRLLSGCSSLYFDAAGMQDFKRTHSIHTLEKQLSEKVNLSHITQSNITNKLDSLLEQKPSLKCSNLLFLEACCRREMLIWETATKGELSGSFLTLYTYIPEKDVAAVQKAARQTPGLTFILKESLEESNPPTIFPTCEIMEIPQTIVNTYGVPNANEMNPAPFYIVTFGFFIGVMFGDVGHSIFGVLAMMMLRPNKWWWISVFWMFYCGIIYNEFFGLNLGWGSSCFVIGGEQAYHKEGCTYAFGIDPVWKVASNSMSFTNSFKMKFAVIVGVIHMMTGTVIKAINGMRNHNYTDVFAVALPQFLFMCSTFVYMDVLIVLKWLTVYTDPSRAPSVISTMINMCLGKFDSSVEPFFREQEVVEKILRIAIVVLIPLLLLAKPLIIWVNKPKVIKLDQEQAQLPSKQSCAALTGPSSDSASPSISTTQSHEDDHNSMQNVMVHQLIETIEFVLGSVSNTASYLRLWALSLAHVQLSEVFFKMLLEGSLQKGTTSSTILLLFLFLAFALVTFGILFCMDTMECFLHSLRLHWVQFQSKFFCGNGFLFKPLDSTHLLPQPK